MVNKLSHQQRLLHRMSLTPQMRQSLNLLGMPMKDLGEYIEAALANNPFLKKLVEDKYADHRKHSNKFDLTMETLDSNTTLKQKDDPRSALLSQVRMSGAKGRILEIAEYLIYELDVNGYIGIELEEAATDLSAELEEAEEALDLIQSMDPPGIGARDIRECMQLQLKRSGKEASLEYEIVTGFVEELARNDASAIAKTLGQDAGKVTKALEAIKKLNPRPASSILAKESERIIPEVKARVDNKKVRIEVNRSNTPSLKLYNPYENELDIIKDPEARQFLKENMEHAKGLIDGLKRRENTICKVVEYILDHQKNLFGKAKIDMKSLTINDVAKALGFHPSTISRVVSNKYIEVNDKVIALKSLLSHGITKANGEVTSKTSVKERIRDIVGGEDRASPLSDERIGVILCNEGIMIKRRTVAKYRESLRILPVRLRKKA